MRQRFDRMLLRVEDCRLGHARVLNERIRGQANAACGCENPCAHIAEAIHVGVERDGGSRLEPVGDEQIRNPTRMHVQHQNHGHGLRTVVEQFVAEADFHCVFSMAALYVTCRVDRP